MSIATRLIAVRVAGSVNLLLLGGVLGLLWSCSKDRDEFPVIGSVGFNVSYHVDGEMLEFDTIRYTNMAGNPYGVTNLEYYISDITLLQAGKPVYADPGIHYIDAREAMTNTIILHDIPVDNYTGISFHIGLNSHMNRSGALPKNLHSEHMAWPDPMGGGYHFLKLEGYFNDGQTNTGYAVHLGTDQSLIAVSIDHAFSIGFGYGQMNLNMNINEWFANPMTYDLNTGNYTMGIADKMQEIAQNGRDVFTLGQ